VPEGSFHVLRVVILLGRGDAAPIPQRAGHSVHHIVFLFLQGYITRMTFVMMTLVTDVTYWFGSIDIHYTQFISDEIIFFT
jgi:hypothetical protein